MKAFWWFKENSIAGMARPGFNSVHWFDLAFDEAVMLGWIGQFSSGSSRLDSFRLHLQSYAPKIFKFHKLDEVSGKRELKTFDEDSGIIEVLNRLNRKTHILKTFEIRDEFIQFTMSEDRLKLETDFLKKHGIGSLISLTERHHDKGFLEDHFKTHHIGIEDLSPPKLEQVVKLAEIIKGSQKHGEKIAVHCLAGIGRTSTMLMAAHIVLGEDPKELEFRLARQNPSFAFTGSQAQFVRSISQTKF